MCSRSRDSQYFGRDEEDAQDMEDSILGANGLGSLETSARDAVRTIMEQTGIETLDDVQDALRQGALKVSCAVPQRAALSPWLKLTTLCSYSQRLLIGSSVSPERFRMAARTLR